MCKTCKVVKGNKQNDENLANQNDENLAKQNDENLEVTVNSRTLDAAIVGGPKFVYLENVTCESNEIEGQKYEMFS